MYNFFFLSLFVFNFSFVKISFAEEVSKGLPQLDFTTYPSLIFWSITSLVILYILMSTVVMPKISMILNDREQNMQNNLIKAKTLKEESDLILEKLNKEIEDVKAEARSLVEKSINDSKKTTDEALQDVSQKMSEMINMSSKKINEEKKKKIIELLDHTTSISESIINKIVEIKVEKKSLAKITKSITEKMIQEHRHGN